MYVMLRVWRANEGGTTDLPDYSETVHVTERCLKTKLQLYTTPRNGTYILLLAVRPSRIYFNLIGTGINELAVIVISSSLRKTIVLSGFTTSSHTLTVTFLAKLL
jgi:hypothetical protein